MPAIFLGVAALVLNILMTRLAQRQRVAIGTLKAIGYSNKQIFRHYFSFGIMVGIVGGVVGILLGLLMAYGNDLSFEDVFVSQLENVMQPDDLVIAISGSGNSENVIRAVDYANQNGATTLGLVGYSGGKLKQIAQHTIWANVQDMQLSEDIHAIFGHIVMQALCSSPDH